MVRRSMLSRLAVLLLLVSPPALADCYSDSECGGGKCRGNKCTTAGGE